MKLRLNTLALLAAAMTSTLATAAQGGIDYEAGVTVNAGSSHLAPYYIASNRGGTLTQQYGTLAFASAVHELDTARRVSWGFGAEAWAGYSSSADYDRYSVAGDLFYNNSQHPARLWVQQLYIEGKYRSVKATLGAKTLTSPVVNPALSSGDMVMSGNARLGGGVNVGFVDFQPVPFTHGWLQLCGQVGYWRTGDSQWLKHHYNYYNNFLTTGTWFNYKYAHFRTRPDQPVVVTFGMQAAYQFGGTQVKYDHGIETGRVEMKSDMKAIFRSMIPGSGGGNAGDTFVEGNHVGSWDVALECRLPREARLRAYHERLWEDGSGIGFQNGFDGLWGIEYRAGHSGPVEGVVLEWVELTNQSGPIHFNPADHEGNQLTGQATGADNYYNNYAYNGYASHGMSIGSPFVKAPLYNTNGYMGYLDTQMRGLHLGIVGTVAPGIGYRALASYRRAWGTPFLPRVEGASCTSLLVETVIVPAWMRQLTLKAQFACDLGKLYGDNAGALVSITYHGNLNFKKR